MLSIAKLRVGQEAYQLTGVAQSLDDYYTGRGEADGVWMGASAERLGLSGPVDGDDLRAVLAGIAPGTGGLSPNGDTIRTHPRRVPGFDLTFKGPQVRVGPLRGQRRPTRAGGDHRSRRGRRR